MDAVWIICMQPNDSQSACICLSRDLNRKNDKTVGVFTECEQRKSFDFTSFKMITSLKKLNKLLCKYTDIISNSKNSPEIEAVSSNLEVRTTGMVETKTTVYRRD